MLMTLIFALILVLFGTALQGSLPTFMRLDEADCPEDQPDLGNYFNHVWAHFKK